MNRRRFLTTGSAAGAATNTGSAFAAQSDAKGNNALARRFTEGVWGGCNAGLLDRPLAPDFVNHDPFPTTAGNRAGEKQAVAIHSAARADFWSSPSGSNDPGYRHRSNGLAASVAKGSATLAPVPAER